VFSILIFSEESEFGAEIAEQIIATGEAIVVARVSDPDQLVEALKSEQPDGLFVDLGHGPHVALDILEAIPTLPPITVVSGPHEDSQLILRAMNLGVKHFFPPAPDQQDLRSVLVRLIRSKAPNEIESNGRVVTVMGTKGGVGATVLACQLAASLQKLGGRTAIVDLNYPLGDVALHFDEDPAYTLADIASDGKALDATYLRSILKVHASGVQILAGPTQMDEAESIRGSHVERILPILRSEFDWVVVDASRSWNEASVRSLSLADLILLVTLFDVPTLNHARQHMKLLEGLRLDGSLVRTVANRYSKGDAVTIGDFSNVLGKEPDALIPNDYATTVESVNQGRPIGLVSPNSSIHAAYQQLALDVHLWCGVDSPSTESSRTLAGRVRNLFSRRSHGSS
jgi:pilus assembly protein CpaE